MISCKSLSKEKLEEEYKNNTLSASTSFSIIGRFRADVGKIADAYIWHKRLQ